MEQRDLLANQVTESRTPLASPVYLLAKQETEGSRQDILSRTINTC